MYAVGILLGDVIAVIIADGLFLLSHKTTRIIWSPQFTSWVDYERIQQTTEA